MRPGGDSFWAILRRYPRYPHYPQARRRIFRFDDSGIRETFRLWLEADGSAGNGAEIDGKPPGSRFNSLYAELRRSHRKSRRSSIPETPARTPIAAQATMTRSDPGQRNRNAKPADPPGTTGDASTEAWTSAARAHDQDQRSKWGLAARSAPVCFGR